MDANGMAIFGKVGNVLIIVKISWEVFVLIWQYSKIMSFYFKKV